MNQPCLRAIGLLCAGVAGVSAADTLLPLSILPGYVSEPVELGVTFGGSIAPIPPHSDQLYVSVGAFGSQSVLRVDVSAGTTSTVAAGFGNIGGLAVLNNGDLAITDNDDFSSDTILRARDNNSDGDFLDVGEITELIVPILVDASFTGAQMAVAPPAAAGLPPGTLLVQTADGGTSAELLAIENPSTNPAYRPAGAAYFNGFPYNGGLAFTPAGHLVMGSSEFPTGRLIGLVNTNGDQSIGAGETHELAGAAELPGGISDLSVSLEHQVIFSGNNGAVRVAALPPNLLAGTIAPPAVLLSTNANYISSARLAAADQSFAPYASGTTAVLYVGGFVTFPAATNLLAVRPTAVSAASDWALYQ